MKEFSPKKIAILGLMCALSLIAFTLESLFPPLILPGAKLGLSNVFILLTVVMVGKWSAFIVLIIKVVFGSIFTGNISAILYGLPSGAIALLLEVVLLSFPEKFGIVSVSILGATVNMTIQNLTFCLVTSVIHYLAYLPYLTLVGVLSGLIVGLVVYVLQKYLPTKLN